MRLVKVKVTKGIGEQIKATAFSVGVETVSIYPLVNYSRNGKVEEQEVVDIETSTPKAKILLMSSLRPILTTATPSRSISVNPGRSDPTRTFAN